MNRFGLARDVPEAIKRAVRQRDGFGCVICGNAIIDYEHFNPEFVDAEAHTVDGIILLCITCHALKTRGRLSRQTISAALKDPKAKQLGFSFGPFDIGGAHPEIVFGDIVARHVPVIIRIQDDDIVRVRAPEEPGGPFRISAYVCNRTGVPMMHIVDNEWRTRTSNWDVAIQGTRLVIRSAVRDIDLQLRTNPPHQLLFEKFNIRHRGIMLECREGHSTAITLLDGRQMRTTGMVLDGCQVGIQIRDGSLNVGCGGGSVSVDDMQFGHAGVPQMRPQVTGDVIPFPRRT